MNFGHLSGFNFVPTNSSKWRSVCKIQYSYIIHWHRNRKHTDRRFIQKLRMFHAKNNNDAFQKHEFSKLK